MNELISEWTIPFILLTKYYIYRSWLKRSLSRVALWPSSGHAPHHWARSPWKQEDKPLHYHFLMTLYLSGTVEFIIKIPQIQFQHLHRPLFPSALRMCSMLQMCTSLGQGVAVWKREYKSLDLRYKQDVHRHAQKTSLWCQSQGWWQEVGIHLFRYKTVSLWILNSTSY